VGKQLESISPVLNEFIRKQHMFFVGTAASDGRVNISPKGMDSLRITNPNQVIWLNSTGSGNESAAHILELDRMTIMFCAFEGAPMILRLFGRASVFHPRDTEWESLYGLFNPLPGARQVFVLEIDLVQTSCGMGVPFYHHVATREDLNDYWAARTPEQIETYWQNKNVNSIDGKPTEIFG
jgi:hypothetical protein